MKKSILLLVRKAVCLGLFFLSISSCVVVKEYEKVYVNDEEMALRLKSCERFETTFQVYREGASGANGGKTGGAADAIKSTI